MTEERSQQLEAQAELERFSRLKDDFLSSVSHELRTPMANISMAAIMLERSLGEIQQRLTSTRSEIDTSKTARYLQLVKDECGREMNLINDLLDFQRLETEERSQQLEAQAELERFSRLKDDFLSSVSHELRSPMANIKMAAIMLESSLGAIQKRLTSTRSAEIDTSSAARYLQLVKDECGREMNLINDLLDFQRLEVDVQTFGSENIHFQTWLPQVVEPFQECANNRQQTLQVDIPANLPTIVSNLQSVERILAELLNNACKYTPPGERITLTARAQEQTIQLQVCNSGVEIPPQELPRVFDKFYRIPGQALWKQGGTGLGLALVQKLSEQLGGGISAESGGGITCFTLELPLQM